MQSNNLKKYTYEINALPILKNTPVKFKFLNLQFNSVRLHQTTKYPQEQHHFLKSIFVISSLLHLQRLASRVLRLFSNKTKMSKIIKTLMVPAVSCAV